MSDVPGGAPEETGSKYYDWERDRPVDPERDGCSLDAWRSGAADRSFAVHPSGFRVFLPGSAIEASDEYRDEDPYAVAGGLTSGFQMRRVDSTLDLVECALGGRGARARILDVACGQGHITAAIRDRFPEAEVSGLDYSISAIDYAQRRYAGIDFAVADAYQPPYAPGWFDVVICNNIWEHVPDPLRLLAGLSRVLRPGGHVVISTPSRYRLGNALRVLLGRPVQLMSSHHVTEYSVGQVIEQLRFGGFDLVMTDSRPLSAGEGTIVQRLVRATAAPALRMATRLVGSHHSWEATVFFLARKRGDVPASG